MFMYYNINTAIDQSERVYKTTLIIYIIYIRIIIYIYIYYIFIYHLELIVMVRLPSNKTVYLK